MPYLRLFNRFAATSLDMSRHVGLLLKSLIAKGALEQRALVKVRALMKGAMRLPQETFVAKPADKRTFAGVNLAVSLEIGFVHKALGAPSTCEAPFCYIRLFGLQLMHLPHVRFNCVLSDLLVTDFASEGSLGVRQFVTQHGSLTGEALVAH